MRNLSVALLATSLAWPACAAEKPSEAFLKKAIEGNFAEAEMGKLAQQNAQDDNVKKYGQTLTDDHSAANQKAMDAAKSMGVTPPDGPNQAEGGLRQDVENEGGGVRPWFRNAHGGRP